MKRRALWGLLLGIGLLTAVACVEQAPPIESLEDTAAPVVTEHAVEAISLTPAPPTDTPTPSPTPTPTPSPTPSPSPTPTPTPAPTPNPKYALLRTDDEEMKVYTFKRASLQLYERPEKDSGSVSLRPYGSYPDGSSFLLLEPAIETDDGNFFRVRYLRTGAEGYAREDDLVESRVFGGTNSYYGILARPNAILWNTPHMGSATVVSRESYEAVRVLGLAGRNDMYAYVLTERGTAGYVIASMIMKSNRTDVLACIDDEASQDAAPFDAAAFADAAAAREGAEAPSGAALVRTLLESMGLYFDPYYYTYFQKPLYDKNLYASRLYTDDMYNSLAFKLFNTSGSLVQSNGKPTQWLYFDDPEQLEKGDLLFFAGVPEKAVAIDQGYRVVFYGKYSGYITDCGIYLGDDRMLTVADGVVTLVEGVFASASEYAQKFDSARRILPRVTDERAYVIETMISNIYDRLGTPYSNGQRLGDRAYDCSGIVCWSLGSMGFKLNERQKLYMDMDDGETTAQGLSMQTSLYWEAGGKTVEMLSLSREVGNSEDLDKLERGDLVFCRNGKNTRVGHVMVYLGNNTVIHSTTVTARYRGTLIAEIRPHLRNLYYYTRRFGAF